MFKLPKRWAIFLSCLMVVQPLFFMSMAEPVYAAGSVSDSFADETKIDGGNSSDYTVSGGSLEMGSGNYFGDDSDGAAHLTSNTSFANTADGDYVVKEYSSLTIDSGVTVTTANRGKGLFIYVSGDVTINGTLSMTARGANADPSAAGVSADGLRLPMFKSGSSDNLASADFSGAGTAIQTAVSNQSGISGDGKIYQITRTGASGALYGSGKESSGFAGSDGSAGQTAGGGTGAYYGSSGNRSGTGGDGADGTCFSGGSGGGGAGNLNYDGEDAYANGGPGGRAYGYYQNAGGGAGNPGGSGARSGSDGSDGTGGVIWLVVGGDLTIGSGGIIEANGADGGDGSNAGGGASGGGIIYSLYAGTLSNSGTVQATGGIGGTGAHSGGNGGNGYTLVEGVDAFVTSSTIQSTNLLSGASNVSDVTSFVYNLSSKPAGTEATVQFSQNASNWYNSAGSLGGTDTLSTGVDNSIDLSGLGWGGSNFYYKVNYTSGGDATPALDDVTVNYLQAPTAPTMGTPTALSTSSIRWSFTDNASNETGFRVFDTGNAQQVECSTANISSCDETGLLANTSYTRKVAAYNGDGNSSYSSTASLYTLAEAPTISLGTPTTTSMPLTAGSTNNLGSGSSGAYFDCTSDICDGGINSWVQTSSDTATGLAANTSYTFRVKARNGDSIETSYSSSSGKYTAIEVPTLSVSSVGTTSLDLAVSGLSNLGTGSSGAYFDCTSASCDTGLNSWVQVTSDSTTGLTPNTQYSFQAKARNGDSVESSYSSGVSQYTLAASPGGPSVGNAQASSLDVSLDKATNPAGTQMALYKEEGSSCDGSGGSYVAADGSDNGSVAVWQDEVAWGTTTVTGLAQMTDYAFCAKAKNADGTETGWGGSGTASTTETDPPSIVSIDSVAGDTSATYYDTSDDGLTVISFSSSDGSGGGVSACKWDSSDVAYDSMSNSCASSSSCSVDLSGEGDKTVYIRCSDVYDNKMSTSEQVDYTIDATAPSGLSAGSSSSSWVKDKPSVAVSSPSDGVSGVAEIRYNWDSDTLGADCSGGTLTSSGADLTGSLSEGSHRLYMCVVDNAGNVSSWDGEYKWDNGNPTVNISTHALTAYKASNIPSKIEGAATDAISAVSSVAVSIYNQSLYWSGAAFDSASRVWLSATGTGSWEYSFVPGSDGTFSLRSRSTDSAGNTQESSDVEFIYDTAAPSIMIDESSDASTDSVTISWTTDEDASTQVEYGTSTSYGNLTSESDTGTRVLGHSQALSSLQSCTTYHYRVKSSDLAGNQLVGSDKTFTTRGCVGDAEVEAESEGTVSKDTGGEVELKEGEQSKVKLTVPANFSDSDADFQVKKINRDKALVSTSTPDASKEAVGDHVYQFDALKSSSERVESFSEAITVTMSYTDTEVSGKDESKLQIYRWDGSAWNELDDCSVNTVTNQITCTTVNFSVFALFGEASASSGGSSGSVVRGACEGLAPGNKAAWIYGAEASEDEIKLFFADGDRPIDKYLLVYGVREGEYLYGVEDIGGYGGGWNEYTVKGLEEGEDYYFKIVGKHACKFGPWSNEFRASTLKEGDSWMNLTRDSSYQRVEAKEKPQEGIKDEDNDSKKVDEKTKIEPEVELKRGGGGSSEFIGGGIIQKSLEVVVGWWRRLTKSLRGIANY